VRIYNACLKCAARDSLKIQDAKITQKKSLSAHHRKSLCSQLKHVSTVGNLKQQYLLLHMSSQYGERRLSNGWDRFRSLGHPSPSKFQRVSRLGFITAPTSLNGVQPNFAWYLAVSWPGTLYVHCWGCCPLTEFCQVQNSLCVQILRMYCQRYCTALEHWESAKLCGVHQRAPSIFGRASITLDIGPHSVFSIFICYHGCVITVMYRFCIILAVCRSLFDFVSNATTFVWSATLK